MSSRILKLFSLSIILFFSVSLVSNAEGVKNNKKGNKFSKVQGVDGSPSRTHLNINNISTWIYNNGDSDIKPDGNSGFIFPKGSNKGAIYESGFVWGADVKGEKRVGGSTYAQGLLPGAIKSDGTAEDPSADHVRIYRVRKDYKSPDADFTSEVNDGEGTAEEVYAQYEKDWNEWPAAYGAPYNDVNGNGKYDPSEDIPGVPGADQTIWYVANDLDVETCRSLYGSDPMGVEMQATFWGYNSTNALGNMIFRKYLIVNKSADAFDSMYVSMWADPDVGDATDDFSGADVDLSLMYTYNGNANDATYGTTPPAVGFDFFQGPIVKGDANDEAIFKGKKIKGFKNLPMSAHYFFINGDAVYNDPDLGQYVTGTLQFHNLFRGKITTSGTPFVDPTTNEVTKFTLAGDPITGSGWVDGLLHPPGDRRQGMVAGPFTMAAGDTQEVVVAEIAAGAFQNVDRLGAVQLLKFYDQVAQNTYDNFFQVPVNPSSPSFAVNELDQEVILTWDRSKDIEEYADGGYEFQGYVVYQLPSKSASFNDATEVATYDLNDGIGKVFGPDFDTESGSVLVKLLKKGSDSGLRRFISLKKDLFNSGQPLFNGTPYYFAVTSYAVNPNDLSVVPTVLESSPQFVEVIPQSTKPGYEEPADGYASDLEITHIGTANASASAMVVNTAQVTGDDYKVTFSQQHYYLAADGKWHETNYPDSIGKLNKDVSPSNITGVSYVASATTRDLKFTLDLVAPDYSYADGVVLTFPSSVEIVSWENSGNSGSTPGVYDAATNSITWGAEDTSQNGPFHGGELMTVTVKTVSLPLSVDYLVWDDGWGWLSGPGYGIAGEYKHATGTTVITEETNYFRTENQWNVVDATTGKTVLAKQRVFGGVDQYADFWGTPANVGNLHAQLADGIQVAVDGSFAAPFSIGGFDVTPAANAGNYDIGDYGLYGWAASGRAADAFGNGTTELDALQQDYELRYTGVWEAPDANGVVVVKDGTGSIATMIGARGYDIADHPLNPNPGTSAPFLMRIPFEVWNIDTGEQVNILVYDRKQSIGDNPFYSFNPTDRMYCYINNTPYDPNTVNSGDAANSDTDNLTWNLVVWSNDFVTGDIVHLQYANPLQIGKDEFTYSTNGVTYSQSQAGTDIEKINVFPNPYYGVNPNEINKYQRYVTFNHLPSKATIRVFNLAGQLVKTVNKDDATQFARWDLQNENHLPVASGMYIVHVDMPDLGKTKVLKVAVIQETQILDRF